MPTALLIADTGDARDAVGLYLAGRGWTTVPVTPDPAAVRQAVAELAPGLVAIDFRGRPAEAAACLRALAGGPQPICLFNAPPDVVSDAPGVTRATRPDEVPSAPGHPAPPHEH